MKKKGTPSEIVLIFLATHDVDVFSPDHRYPGSLPFLLFRLFIDSSGVLPRVSQYYCPQLSRAKEKFTKNSVIVHEEDN